MTPIFEVQISRNILADIHKEARRLLPKGMRVSKAAWIIRLTGDHRPARWEFHGPDHFFWTGLAENAYEAKARGWAAFIYQRTGKRPHTIIDSKVW